MKVVKISIFFTDITPVIDFRQKAGCSFWTAFRKKFNVEFEDCSIENESSYQTVFYAPSDLEPEVIKAAVAETAYTR